MNLKTLQLSLTSILVGVLCVAAQPKPIEHERLGIKEWHAQVESVFKEGGDLLDLENYDHELLQKYFRASSEDTPIEMYIKVMGLVAFGTPEDQEKVNALVHRLGASGEYPDIEVALHGIPFRNGDKRSRELIMSLPNGAPVVLLAWSRNEEARNELARIAADPKRPVPDRLNAIKALAKAGDRRSLKIALSNEFVGAAEAYGLSFSVQMLNLSEFTGLELFNHLKSPTDAEKMLRERAIPEIPRRTITALDE